ncbi:hypothetical protein AAFN85_02920 [Mucilaginibacter sp. CAU 1740]|uniref:hypothetical protein n=1 Tax=Mucilaginibacter sp. CAU 1740 TaxID=3140365 RepID=UPI00325AFCE6
MEACTLCQKQPADKTGSHLIPSFLLKMVENYDGSNKRDRGLGFRLTAEDTEVHFERAVSGEKITEVMGELPEEELRNYPSPSIRDYVYCSNCEKFFGKLESAYAPTLSKDGKDNYPSTDDPLTATLFWLSIFWRASAAGTYGFSLGENEQEQLRSILVYYTESDAGSDQPEGLQTLRYKIIRSVGFAKQLTGFISFDPAETEPYCAVIGEYAAFLYFDQVKTAQIPDDFFGFEKVVADAKVNSSTTGEQILAVPDDVFLAANNKLALKMSELKTNYFSGLIIGTAKIYFGFNGKLPADTIKGIAIKIPDSDQPSGKKYSKKEVMELIASELSVYFESLKIESK